MSLGERRCGAAAANSGGERPRAEGDQNCELCEAARFTEWFHEDEQCWIAECESCSLPMVVWRVHDPYPPVDVKAELHAKLRAVVEQHFETPIRIDDHLRTINTHYHAHARPVGVQFGAGLHRR